MRERTKEALIFSALLVAVSFLYDSVLFTFLDAFRGSAMDSFMRSLSSGAVIAVFFIAISVFLLRKTHNFILLWSSIIASSAVVFLLKLIIARPRLFGTELFILGFPDYSFPSHHAAIMFAGIYILAKSFPKEAQYFVAYAVLVAISRIYLHFHHLSDVLAGAWVGFFIGYLVFHLERRYGLFGSVLKVGF